MRLIEFHFHATHVKGKELTDTDKFSRALNQQPTTMDKPAEKKVMIYVNLIANNIPISNDSLEEIRIYTQQYSTGQNFTNRDRVDL